MSDINNDSSGIDVKNNIVHIIFLIKFIENNTFLAKNRKRKNRYKNPYELF